MSLRQLAAMRHRRAAVGIVIRDRAAAGCSKMWLKSKNRKARRCVGSVRRCGANGRIAQLD